ncbi:MAG: hypothetical protein IIB85_02265 [Chloroflexi bacterium]|nr:hypothetical protein [Chloroflexota bacterium]
MLYSRSISDKIHKRIFFLCCLSGAKSDFSS